MISWRKHFKKGIITVALALFSSISFYSQDLKGDAKKGEAAFKANCTACHALDKQVIGPALGGVVDRLKKEQNLGQDWLFKWIKDNNALRASGDKYANEVYNKFNKTAMLQFPALSDQDIADILEYTTNPPAPETKVDGSNPATGNSELTAIKEQQKTNANVLLISLLAIAGLLFWVLLKLKNLVKLHQSEDLKLANASEIQSFGDFFDKYKMVGNVLLGLFVTLALYGAWNWLMWIGVYKGYQPKQPIYFSHKIHAGENKIDCQLCHSSAKYGKVSEIPSVNVCMNCHKGISEYKGKYMEPGKDKAFYDGEIKKIYEYSGWDPDKQAYTGKSKPIEWTRVHNMPDFVFFNHSTHVVSGEKAIIASHNAKNPKNQIDVVCKACHGQIDTMNVVKMANNFTMGWCIECHRTTEIDMSNGYNKQYFETLHNKLKKQYGSGTKITVDAIGGLECGKCHY